MILKLIFLGLLPQRKLDINSDTCPSPNQQENNRQRKQKFGGKQCRWLEVFELKEPAEYPGRKLEEDESRYYLLSVLHRRHHDKYLLICKLNNNCAIDIIIPISWIQTLK